MLLGDEGSELAAGHGGTLPALATCAALLIAAIAVVAGRTGSP
ncbi:hypothetical protein [Actinoplanes subtropicus]|nr:hypothetical protein [Actinoplanes subtropicus]